MGCRTVALVAALVCSTQSAGETRFPWIENSAGLVHLDSGAAGSHALRLAPEVEGIFLDPHAHRIGRAVYLATFHVSRSKPEKPMRFCGAGSEIWLQVYEALDSGLQQRARVLVSSCLRSISLKSQNTGAQRQEQDFSSVRWTSEGFSVEWFGDRHPTTHYRLREGKFIAENSWSLE